MDAFSNPIAKIKRRLKLERRIRTLVVKNRVLMKVLRIEEEFSSLSESIGRTNAELVKRDPSLTIWERNSPSTLAERKEVLDYIYDQGEMIESQTKEDKEWLEYVHSQTIKTGQKLKSHITSATKNIEIRTARLMSEYELKREAANKMASRMEMLVNVRAEISQEIPDINPLLVDQIAKLEASVEKTEKKALEANAQIKLLLANAGEGLINLKAPRSRAQREKLAKRLVNYCVHLNRKAPDYIETVQAVDTLLTRWNINTPSEHRNYEPDKKARLILIAILYYGDFELEQKDHIDNYLSRLFRHIRHIKSLRDTLDQDSPDNERILKETNAYIETCMTRLEDIVKLRAELTELNDEFT